MNKKQLIDGLESFISEVNKSDFSGALSGTTEQNLEHIAIDLLNSTIDVLKVSTLDIK